MALQVWRDSEHWIQFTCRFTHLSGAFPTSPVQSLCVKAGETPLSLLTFETGDELCIRTPFCTGKPCL